MTETREGHFITFNRDEHSGELYCTRCYSSLFLLWLHQQGVNRAGKYGLWIENGKEADGSDDILALVFMPFGTFLDTEKTISRNSHVYGIPVFDDDDGVREYLRAQDDEDRLGEDDWAKIFAELGVEETESEGEGGEEEGEVEVETGVDGEES